MADAGAVSVRVGDGVRLVAARLKNERAIYTTESELSRRATARRRKRAFRASAICVEGELFGT